VDLTAPREETRCGRRELACHVVDPEETTMSTADVSSRDAHEIPQVGNIDWPSWYAEYVVAEQAGTELPT
jgi:hypothetical protein